MAYPQWWHLTMKVNGLPLSSSCAAVLGITTAICHDPRPPNQTTLNLFMPQ